MENGKYSSDNYLIHLNLSANILIMLTDKRLMCIKKGMMSHNWECDWSEEWNNCHKVSVSEDKLKIKITTKVCLIFHLISHSLLESISRQLINKVLEKCFNHFYESNETSVQIDLTLRQSLKFLSKSCFKRIFISIKTNDISIRSGTKDLSHWYPL